MIKKMSFILAIVFVISIYMVNFVGCTTANSSQQSSNNTTTTINDLSILSASTVSSIQFYDSTNDYKFIDADQGDIDFFVSGVLRYVHKLNTDITVDKTPIISENGNVYFDSLKENITSKIANWGIDSKEYILQNRGIILQTKFLDTTLDLVERDQIKGYYIFRIAKNNFKYAVNKIAFVSLFRNDTWGGATGSRFGMGANAIPDNSGDGSYGKKLFRHYYKVDFSLNETTNVVWFKQDDLTRDGIKNIGYKNFKDRVEIYLKGSLITTNLSSDAINAKTIPSGNSNQFWCPVFIIFGK